MPKASPAPYARNSATPWLEDTEPLVEQARVDEIARGKKNHGKSDRCSHQGSHERDGKGLKSATHRFPYYVRRKIGWKESFNISEDLRATFTTEEVAQTDLRAVITPKE